MDMPGSVGSNARDVEPAASVSVSVPPMFNPVPRLDDILGSSVFGVNKPLVEKVS